jgi:hypothetical protein
MKIPSDQGPIDVHGSQEATRRAEGNWIDYRAIHNIDEAEDHQHHKYIRDKAASVDQPKSLLLCEDIAEQKVLFRFCWGPSSSKGPQKHDLTMFPEL